MKINEDSEMDFGFFRPWKYESHSTLVHEMFKSTVTYHYRIANVFGNVITLCITEEEAKLICDLANADFLRNGEMGR